MCADLQARGELDPPAGSAPLPPFEKWSFRKRHFLQYLVDLLTVGAESLASWSLHAVDFTACMLRDRHDCSAAMLVSTTKAPTVQVPMRRCITLWRPPQSQRCSPTATTCLRTARRVSPLEICNPVNTQKLSSQGCTFQFRHHELHV